MENKRTVGDALREMRESVNVKRSELAEAVDVTHSYVYQVEENQQMPSPEYLKCLITMYLHMSVEEESDKARRVDVLISMTKTRYIEKNRLKFERRAEQKYGGLYGLVSQN